MDSQSSSLTDAAPLRAAALRGGVTEALGGTNCGMVGGRRRGTGRKVGDVESRESSLLVAVAPMAASGAKLASSGSVVAAVEVGTADEVD